MTLAAVVALGAGLARSANVACPPSITSNTGNTLAVSGGATCTVTATVNVLSGSTAGATVCGGTSTSPTALINDGTIAITSNGSGRAMQSSGNNAVLVIQNNLGAPISTNDNDTAAAGTASTSADFVSLTMRARSFPLPRGTGGRLQQDLRRDRSLAVKGDSNAFA